MTRRQLADVAKVAVPIAIFAPVGVLVLGMAAASWLVAKFEDAVEWGHPHERSHLVEFYDPETNDYSPA